MARSSQSRGFGEKVESEDAPYVCRLMWSPNSAYLAAVELTPGDEVTYMTIYVLDMSKFKS